MKLRQLLATSLFVGLLGDASAGVVYRWTDLVPYAPAGLANGVLEIDSAVWRAGSSFTSASIGGTPTVPPQGIQNFSFKAQNGPRVDLAVRACPFIDDGFGTECRPGQETYTFGSYSFALTFGSLLTGSFEAHEISEGMRMSSNTAGIWTVSMYGSDAPDACYGGCSGGTGFWALDLSTAPGLPEPTPFALALAGLLAAGVVRRRQLGAFNQLRRCGNTNYSRC